MPEREVDRVTGFVRYRRTPEEEYIRKIRKEVELLKKRVASLEARLGSDEDEISC